MNGLNQLMANRRQYVRKVVIDLIAILILGIPVLVLFAGVEPYKRGFNCDDESIRYPYKDNTIPSVVNYLYSSLIPIITIAIVEVLYYKKRLGNDRRYQKPDDQTVSTDGRDISVDVVQKEGTDLSVFWQIYLRLAPFAFGALISQLTTDIAKYSIGRLRPHFIDVCQPQIDNGMYIFRAGEPCPPNLENLYFTDYKCSSSLYTEHRMRDAHLSFMSGHSSFAAYCLVYLVIYLQLRLRWSTLGFLRPLYQAVLIYIVIYTGFSRISDYKHHWSDVLIGLIQGTVVAILTTAYISDLPYVRSDPQPRWKNCTTGTNSPDSYGTAIAAATSPKRNYDSCRVEMDENISLSKCELNT